MSNVIQLPQNLTIHQIEEQFNDLNLKLDEMEDDVIFDAAAVETVDTSGLQTLLVLSKAAIDNGKKLEWQNVPDVLSSSAKKIGVDEALAL